MANEGAWRTGKTPDKLLSAVKGKVSDRQLRLFACACARLYWDRFSPQGRQAVEAAERFLDDPTTQAAMRAAGLQAAATYQLLEYEQGPVTGREVDALARATAYSNAWRAACSAITPVRIAKVPKKQQEQSA